jgi:cobalt-zinc-cadmium resistance protein CzcA
VVIGGIITSTLLTLLVLPALYAWLGGPRRVGIAAPQGNAAEGNA